MDHKMTELAIAMGLFQEPIAFGDICSRKHSKTPAPINRKKMKTRELVKAQRKQKHQK